ncbi:hypothetical protein T484DRAFT_1910867 [Baffinella frigidus]|nr:hypothetical protein T484DRAFT_1910867 [Cryptophyta sp. CCMP2293]
MNGSAEHAIELALTAMAAGDHDFALTVCRRASEVILEPRLSAMIGECLEAKGSEVDAICCYRSALSLDTSLVGAPLPEAMIVKAHARINAIATKLGMTETWSQNATADASLDVSAIALRIRGGRIADAAGLYKGSEAYRDRTHPAFHVEVAKALREVVGEQATTLAQQALEVALAIGGTSSADKKVLAEAAHEMGDIAYEARKYDTSQEWYEKAIQQQVAAGGPGAMPLSRSGVANCEKDKGNLAGAIAEYRKALALAPQDPTFIFNLAQAYEYVQDYDSAIALLSDFTLELAKNQNRDMTTVNHFAVPLLFIKLVYAAGPAHHGKIQPLLEQIKSFPAVATQAVQALATHWAYYFFLSRLLASASLQPPAPGVPPLFMIGDSHVLSSAWAQVTFRGRPHTLTPKLITGLQAYHLRPGNKFLTVANAEECFKSLPEGTTEALWVVGEIDCRDGITGAVAKGKYASIEQGVEVAIAVYREAVKNFQERFGVTLYPVSVCPPTNPAYKDRIKATRLFNNALRAAYPNLLDMIKATHLFNNALRAAYPNLLDMAAKATTKEGVLSPEYNCDGTHMNRRAVTLLQEELDRQLKNPDEKLPEIESLDEAEETRALVSAVP